jgi:hypothetical protein
VTRTSMQMFASHKGSEAISNSFKILLNIFLYNCHSRRSRVPLSVSLHFLIDLAHPAARWPWGRLSLKQKYVPGSFLAVKDSGCVRITRNSRRFVSELRSWQSRNKLNHSIISLTGQNHINN